MNNKELITTLREITEESKASIRKEVATEALNYDDESSIVNFFNDLMQYGCVSGMIGKLIYYHDTHTFYNTYYNEIEDLRHEYEEQGIELRPQGDLMNWYAWLAFEETARILAEELGIIS